MRTVVQSLHYLLRFADRVKRRKIRLERANYEVQSRAKFAVSTSEITKISLYSGAEFH